MITRLNTGLGRADVGCHDYETSFEPRTMRRHGLMPGWLREATTQVRDAMVNRQRELIIMTGNIGVRFDVDPMS